jgi:sn-glycerol 3-phosphate transport system ATP-binding protein
MDEPLSNLDAKLRHEMRVEIRALQQRLGMTVVYVTHDQAEAMSMADKVVLMREGRIEQEGAPDNLYNAPATVFAASFIGTPPMNLIDLADGPDGAIIAGADPKAVLEGRGGGLKLGIRPEHLELTDDGGLPARLIATDYLGADTIVATRIGEQTLLVRVPGRYALAPGETTRLTWSTGHVHVFDATTGLRARDHRPRRIAA